MEGDMLEDDGITAAIEELQSRLGDLQSSIDQALQVCSLLVGYFISFNSIIHNCIIFREEREEGRSCTLCNK